MTWIPRVDILRWGGALLCALAANMAQFGIIIYSTLSSGIVKHWMFVGTLQSALLHVGFGLAAGLIGWAVFRGAQSVVKRFF